MELEDAERFVAAAERDYRSCVEDYEQLLTLGRAGAQEALVMREARADVLAAQQVRELAQRELDDARRHSQAGKDYAGMCDACGREGPCWVVGAAVLCAMCAERAAAADGEGEER